MRENFTVPWILNVTPTKCQPEESGESNLFFSTHTGSQKDKETKEQWTTHHTRTVLCRPQKGRKVHQGTYRWSIEPLNVLDRFGDFKVVSKDDWRSISLSWKIGRSEWRRFIMTCLTPLNKMGEGVKYEQTEGELPSILLLTFLGRSRRRTKE